MKRNIKRLVAVLLLSLLVSSVFANPKASYICTKYCIIKDQLVFPDLRNTSISDIEKYVTGVFFKTTIVEELNDLPNLPPQDLGWFDSYYRHYVILSKSTPSGDILYLKQDNCVRIFYVYFDTSINNTGQKKK